MRVARTLSLSLPPCVVGCLEALGAAEGKTAARVAAEVVAAHLAVVAGRWRADGRLVYLDDMRAGMMSTPALATEVAVAVGGASETGPARAEPTWFEIEALAICEPTANAWRDPHAWAVWRRGRGGLTQLGYALARGPKSALDAAGRRWPALATRSVRWPSGRLSVERTEKTPAEVRGEVARSAAERAALPSKRGRPLPLTLAEDS